MLDKVVASFLASTGGAGGVGLIGFVFKGLEGSSSRRCLFQTLTSAPFLEYECDHVNVAKLLV
jgi:hypothetical protein